MPIDTKQEQTKTDVNSILGGKPGCIQCDSYVLHIKHSHDFHLCFLLLYHQHEILDLLFEQ